VHFELAAADDTAFGATGSPVALAAIDGHFILFVQNNVCPVRLVAPPVLRSDDGRSWVPVDPEGQVFPPGSYVSSATEANGELLAVGTATTPEGSGPVLWRTRDGSTWTMQKLDPEVFAPAPVNGTPIATLDSIGFAGGTFMIFGTTRLRNDPAVPPQPGTIIGQAWQSTDTTTWTRSGGDALAQPGHLVVVVADTPTGLVAFADPLTPSGQAPSQVWRSVDDGHTWSVDSSTVLPVPSENIATVSAALESDNKTFIAGSEEDGSYRGGSMWESTDGRTWTASDLGKTDATALSDITKVGSSLISVGSSYDGASAVESVDGGASWSRILFPDLPRRGYSARFVASNGALVVVIGSYVAAPTAPSDPTCSLPESHLMSWSGR
jgi:hypothetical protein